MNPSVAIIRPVLPDEVIYLRNFSETVFVKTFASKNTVENIELYINKAFDINQILTEFKNPNSAFYFLEINKEIAGYLKLNWADAQNEKLLENSVEIERIYIKSQFQGKRLGTQLLKKAIDIAIEKDAAWIWLGVWNENHEAIRFYKKHGFIKFAEHDFMLGTELQVDVLMKLKLSKINN